MNNGKRRRERVGELVMVVDNQVETEFFRQFGGGMSGDAAIDGDEKLRAGFGD